MSKDSKGYTIMGFFIPYYLVEHFCYQPSKCCK